MTIAMLESAATILGDVAADLVFVGGVTVDAFIVEPGGTTTRPTVDVDVVVGAATRAQYEKLADKLRARGLGEDPTSNVICRWRRGNELVLDVMPSSATVFGFTNPWYEAAIDTAQQFALPSGKFIQLCNPAVFIATKLAAFEDRGSKSPISSHDLEDIVRVFDGRPQLVDEIAAARDDVREHLTSRFDELLQSRIFTDAVRGFLLPDEGSQARAHSIVLPRMRAVAGAAQ